MKTFFSLITLLLASSVSSASASLPAGMGSSPSNIDGGSVFANFAKARQDGQFFWLRESAIQNETPSSPVVDKLHVLWCSNLEFTTFDSSADATGTDADASMGTTVAGYTGHCVYARLQDEEDDAAGDQSTHETLAPDEFGATQSISAVYVPHTNIFEGNAHSNRFESVYRFWDDGRPTMSSLGWEADDESDITIPNATASSNSNFRKITWISVDEAASLLSQNATEFTPDAFDEVYKEVWSKNHQLRSESSTQVEDTKKYLRANVIQSWE
ncbi:hypothetical protein ACHAWF_008313 [Thalassiosira exigua]